MTTLKLSAPTGRHSPAAINVGIAEDAAPTIGMTPLQGYDIMRLHKTQGFTLGYRMTHLRCYGGTNAKLLIESNTQ